MASASPSRPELVTAAARSLGARGWRPPLVVGLAAGLWMAAAAGVPLAGPEASAAAVAAILLAGLPHGALDLHIRPAGRAALPRYLLLGGAMAALWALSAPLALALFLLIAAGHFAQDWRDALPAPLALGVGAALLAFPALLHPGIVDGLFGAIAGADAGPALTRAHGLVALPAGVAAAIAVARLARHGQGARAARTLALLLSAMVLPPLVAFALFFCAEHSPRHLREAVASLPPDLRVRAAPIAAAMTALAMLLGVGLTRFLVGDAGAPLDRFVAGAFVLLSVLTVPHVLMNRAVWPAAGVRPVRSTLAGRGSR
jgi:Brp/Blh family beta-carotene 15,15'-monooxygenase